MGGCVVVWCVMLGVCLWCMVFGLWSMGSVLDV